MDHQTGDEETVSAGTVAAFGPGTVLNGLYRIDARLGEGGMGEVYRATNIANHQRYAVKVIARQISGHPELEQMFRREAQVQERIESTAVARLRTFGHDQALDLLYFVTDFIEGESLLARLKRQPATPDELVVLLRRVATGLVAVHEAGAIHRDLSPDNIILPSGDVARAKLIDFGIVKDTDATQATLGGLKGKFGYMPPEQLGMVADARVGPWTDLYSLALTIIAFARGKPLDMGYSLYSAAEARRAPIDLSAAPPALRPLFERMLAFDWHDRLQSAREVLDWLDKPPPVLPSPPAVEPATVEIVPPPLPPPPWWRRLRLWAARLTIVAIGLALVFWLATSLIVRRDPVPAPTSATPLPLPPDPAPTSTATPTPLPTQGPLPTPTLTLTPKPPQPTPSPSPEPSPGRTPTQSRPSESGQPDGSDSHSAHRDYCVLLGSSGGLFGAGQAELTDDLSSGIDHVARYYKQDCADAVTVIVASEVPGADTEKLALARRRVSAVRRALVANGVPDRKILVKVTPVPPPSARATIIGQTQGDYISIRLDFR